MKDSQLILRVFFGIHGIILEEKGIERFPL